MGHSMEILDIGGGLPANYINHEIIDALQSTHNDPLGYKIMAEPGRYLSSKSCLLGTRIIGKRVKNNRVCYHLNDGLYHSFNCILMDGVSFENDNQ